MLNLGLSRARKVKSYLFVSGIVLMALIAIVPLMFVFLRRT